MLESYVHRCAAALRRQRHPLRGAEPLRAGEAGGVGLAPRAFRPHPEFRRCRPFQARTRPIGKRFVYCGRLDQSQGRRDAVCAPRRRRSSRSPSSAPGPTRRACASLPTNSTPTSQFLGHLSQGGAGRQSIETARAIVRPVGGQRERAAVGARSLCRRPPGDRLAHRRHPGAGARGETGVLFPTGDADALAAALARFASLTGPPPRRHGRGRPAMGRAAISPPQSTASASSISTTRSREMPHEHAGARPTDAFAAGRAAARRHARACAVFPTCRAASSVTWSICRAAWSSLAAKSRRWCAAPI